MSYNADKHQRFSDRLTRWMLHFQKLREEAVTLRAIYVDEGKSGANASFVATPQANKGELQAAVGLLADVETMLSGGVTAATDRRPIMSTFLTGEQIQD